MRRHHLLAAAAVAVLILIGVWSAPTRPSASSPSISAIGGDDAGDARATTTYDGAMVRKRAAIAVHPVAGADRAKIRSELAAAAKKADVGALTEATFAVFSEEMLNYLVPEMTFVLPEGVPVTRGEAFMRDHQPADVAFYLVEPVLLHDLTFAVVPAAGVTPTAVRDAEDSEGILADTLNHYETAVQSAGVTVRYFGAILSDPAIAAVRDAMARAAQVPADRVQVTANEPGPGIDLSNGGPLLDDESPHHH
ncbi:hypothetical protein [Paractinoplanes durhamensis]|uniref:Secreted protein n=2 Tax=Paractinoplanes durhamensis TaxID=113563 RepID=A0ABQ3YNA0_9ACTN|nr:hypothetical protein [Actinoplanes durhamensis]GID99036.1 hypothetical protein Adu01nite_03870 [Actinoplanes durhamensis]